MNLLNDPRNLFKDITNGPTSGYNPRTYLRISQWIYFRILPKDLVQDKSTDLFKDITNGPSSGYNPLRVQDIIHGPSSGYNPRT